MNKTVAFMAVTLGFTGVALGAFGAHGLKNIVSPAMLDVWKTAVNYQMYHTPVLLLLSLFVAPDAGRLRSVATSCLFAGVAIFSGSLYALVWFDQPILGMLTPFGGVLMLAGWLTLGLAIYRHKLS